MKKWSLLLWASPLSVFAQKHVVQFVNPLIGTQRMGHTYPGATVPFGKVQLDDDNITAELTTTTRTGFHQYTFPKTSDAHIIFDLMHGIYNYDDKNVWTFIRVENDTLVTGYRQTNGWARTRTVYFAMTF